MTISATPDQSHSLLQNTIIFSVHLVRSDSACTANVSLLSALTPRLKFTVIRSVFSGLLSVLAYIWILTHQSSLTPYFKAFFLCVHVVRSDPMRTTHCNCFCYSSLLPVQLTTHYDVICLSSLLGVRAFNLYNHFCLNGHCDVNSPVMTVVLPHSDFKLTTITLLRTVFPVVGFRHSNTTFICTYLRSRLFLA